MPPPAPGTPEPGSAPPAALRRRRGPLAALLATAVGVAALIYAAWGVDASVLGAALGRYGWVEIAALLAVSVLAYPLLGLRIRFLLGGRLRLRDGIAASVLAVGLNALLPARLGEVAKILHLHRHSVHSYPRLVGAVFWERFADINALLLLGAATSLLAGIELVLVPLAAAVAAAWVMIVIPTRFPGSLRRLTAWIPHAGLRRGALRLARLILMGLRPRLLGGLAVLTAGYWLVGVAQSGWLLLGVADFALEPAQVLIVFSVATLGLALPAAPGGLGVFEAAVVLSLGWFGVAQEQALAAALVLHAAILLPPLLGSAVVVLRSGLSLPHFASR